MRNWLIVVPTRLDSRRLPRKALCLLDNRELILRVYDNIAHLHDEGAKIIIGTDAKRNFYLCKKNNVPVEMTAKEHPSGTDRCYEIGYRHDRKFILNVQGDDPFVQSSDLLALCRHVEENANIGIATLVFASTSQQDYEDPQVVKVVATKDNRALYFSRRPLPFTKTGKVPAPFFLKHIGVYAFRRSALTKFCQEQPSVLEKQEKLEQLRSLELGIDIYLHRATHDSKGINTIEDVLASSKDIKKTYP